jgi:protein-tyrosine phosphatase
MAELLLRRSLREIGLTWSVSSAGTEALEDQPIHPLVREVLAAEGIESQDFRSRRVTPEMVGAADLILTAETAHRRSLVATELSALGKSYTLTQFARFAALVQLDSDMVTTLGNDLLAGVRIARSRLQPAREGQDDITDPIGGGRREFKACQLAITSAVSEITRPLRRSPATAAVADAPDEIDPGAAVDTAVASGDPRAVIAPPRRATLSRLCGREGRGSQ